MKIRIKNTPAVMAEGSPALADICQIKQGNLRLNRRHGVSGRKGRKAPP